VPPQVFVADDLQKDLPGADVRKGTDWIICLKSWNTHVFFDILSNILRKVVWKGLRSDPDVNLRSYFGF
jgi:hypothetical protein